MTARPPAQHVAQRPPSPPRRSGRASVCQAGMLGVLLLLASPQPTKAQTPPAAPLRVLAKPLASEITLPFVQGGAPGLAGRINQTIWIDTLERPAPAHLSDVVTLSEDEQRTTPSARFKVLRQDRRVLSLELALEGCGAYCESYHRPFAFDLRDGRWLMASDLFTPDGLKTLQPRLAAQRAARVQQHIRQLKRVLRATEQRRQRPDDDAPDALALYEACLPQWLPGADPVYRHLSDERLAIGPSHITFTAGRCSNHAMRALDEIGDFHNRLPITSLRAQLSPYGRVVLLGEALPDARPASGLLSQVLRGTLDGKLPITLRLVLSEPSAPQPASPLSVSGSYFYDRVRQLIPLRGTLQGDQLTLTEGENSDDAKAPVFKLTVSAQGLRGTWRQGERSLPVEITP